MKKTVKALKKKKPRVPSPRQWQAFERAYIIENTGNMVEARHAYERAARLGSPHAQINLANLYDDGKFGSRNRARAIALYKRAIKHGFPEGAYNLAQLYRLDNVRRWYLYWLRRATALGDSDAREDLRSANTAKRNTKLGARAQVATSRKI